MDGQITQNLPQTKKLISIGDLLNKALSFYKSKFSLILTLALIPFVNFIVLGLLVGLIDAQADKINFLLGFGLLALIFAIFAVVINLWVQIALFYAIKERNIATSAKSLLVFSWNNMGGYLWVAFLMGIISLLGFILFIIPGILLSIWFSLSLYVFVFEGKIGMQALYRSKELVKGYWWAVFGRLLLFGIVAAIFSAIPFVGNLINIFFIIPFGISYGYFIYEDLKRIQTLPSQI